MSATRWKVLAAVPALYFLYFFGLTRAGMVGPDEPRYASIGREMARSADWVTPRLWGQAWFEKPPLVYWLSGIGHASGLGEDLGPRLPVALLSVAFLCCYFLVLRGELGGRAAGYSTVILGTSAGWLAFSHIGVPDLPMTATFSAAMLLGLRWSRTAEPWIPPVSGALLGLAALGKGFVPLALALPLLWLIRRGWKAWVAPLPALAFLAVGAPWYALCWLRHGRAFWDEFFWRHHFARFASGETLHPEPFWFYLPVLAAAAYPWTFALAGLFQKRMYGNRGPKFLLLWLGFGFVFFSASAGKLPGYLLPLLPALAALMGLGLASARDVRWVLSLSGAALALIPVAGMVLPQALAAGLSRSSIGGWDWKAMAACAGLSAAAWIAERRGRRDAAVGAILAGTVCGVVWLKQNTLPEIDRLVSARPLWRVISRKAEETCIAEASRTLRYGLNYYSQDPLPDCAGERRRFRVIQRPSGPAEVLEQNP